MCIYICMFAAQAHGVLACPVLVGNTVLLAPWKKLRVLEAPSPLIKEQ